MPSESRMDSAKLGALSSQCLSIKLQAIEALRDIGQVEMASAKIADEYGNDEKRAELRKMAGDLESQAKALLASYSNAKTNAQTFGLELPPITTKTSSSLLREIVAGCDAGIGFSSQTKSSPTPEEGDKLDHSKGVAKEPARGSIPTSERTSKEARPTMEVNPLFRGRDFTVKNDLCFVLMPLRDPFTSIFERHIKPVAAKSGLRAVKADDINSNKPIMEDVWVYLNQSRLVIADLSESNPNVCYELGIAHTLGKQVIMISQDSKRIPFDVGHVRYINYVYPSQIERFERTLHDTIAQVLKDSKTRTTYVRREGKAVPNVSNVRIERLASLTTWARKLVKDNYVKFIHDKDTSFYATTPRSYFEQVAYNIRKEAMRRWSLSSSTAKDYSDTVLLTVEPEFKNRVEDEVAKENTLREQQIRESMARQHLPFEILTKLETSSQLSVERQKLLDALIETGKFTKEEANLKIHEMLRQGAIYEPRPGFVKRLT